VRTIDHDDLSFAWIGLGDLEIPQHLGDSPAEPRLLPIRLEMNIAGVTAGVFGLITPRTEAL
jgi:hypothetical protein